MVCLRFGVLPISDELLKIGIRCGMFKDKRLSIPQHVLKASAVCLRVSV